MTEESADSHCRFSPAGQAESGNMIYRYTLYMVFEDRSEIYTVEINIAFIAVHVVYDT
jgi:hypothetical protein